MKKTLRVTRLLALGPVAAAAWISVKSDDGLLVNLAESCAQHAGGCAVAEHRAFMF